ncbi:MAG: cupin domain-containing protein [Anaerolineaceae bacterium]|nr:cupin domain-containing protein [Anaerolineaceae bacterium]MBN2677568.1 cupin domain-containing protein [Anaerolineaceae bacterium]
MPPISPTRSFNRQSHWRESLIAVMQPASENVDATETNVGRRLQELRLMQGLSIRSLAEKSGLNFNTLSLIENGKTSPNVSTLQQLATALRVPITAFFDAPSIFKDIVFQKNGQRPLTMLPHGELEDLGGGLALGEATPLLMTSNPKTNSGPDTIVHTGQEFVYCIDGRIIYCVGKQEFNLEKGDSLIFQGHIPHRWENRDDVPSHCLLIICPSDNADRSVGQHLLDKLEEQ